MAMLEPAELAGLFVGRSLATAPRRAMAAAIEQVRDQRVEEIREKRNEYGAVLSSEGNTT
jgi:hypothetical protein